MTRGNAFEIRRGVMRFGRPPEGGDLLFVCWPVLVYRVTAPVLRVRHLNIIEKVILALCQAGVRQPTDLAAKIHQSTELCEFVLRQLSDSRQIDGAGVPTDQGRESVVAGRLSDEPELIVTHVFQDPLTGQLWPRARQDLRFERVRRISEDQVSLRLITASAPPVSASVIAGPAQALPRAPTPQDIITAIAGHRLAELARRVDDLANGKDGRSPAASTAEHDLRALSTELVLPQDSPVHRVFEIGPPMAEYVLLWFADQADGGPAVRDPFGLEPNSMLRRLVAERLRTDPSLASVVSDAGEASAARAAADYRSAGEKVKHLAEARLVQELGGELRRRPEVMELLLGLEEAVARHSEAGLESVVNGAFRMYEHLFRRLVAEYPPPARPSWATSRQQVTAPIARSALEKAATQLGLDPIPGTYLNSGMSAASRNPGARSIDLSKAFVPGLLPYVLIAAADPRSRYRENHPFRELASRRPGLITDLSNLGKLRNRGAHGTRDATARDDVDFCRSLAIDAARLLVSMPPPPTERN